MLDLLVLIHLFISASVSVYEDTTQETVYRIGNNDLVVDAVKWTDDGYRLPAEVIPSEAGILQMKTTF